MDKRVYTAVTGGKVVALAKLIDKKHEEIPAGGTTLLQMESPKILHELTPGGNTPLHLAAYHGHLQIVKMLLKLVTDDLELGNEGSSQFVVAQNSQGNTALHEAAKGGHYPVVTCLLEHIADMAGIVNKNGETALFKAAEEGHKKIVVKLVLFMSANYDRRTSDGHTPLHAAVSHGQKGVIQSLLGERPDLLIQADSFGRTALHSAAYVENSSQIAKLLLDKDTSLCYKVDMNQQSALQIAVIEGNVDLVRSILTYSPDCLEIVDKDGRNALHLAAENAVEIFEKISIRIKNLVHLIMSKESINNLDNHGKTALDIVLEKMTVDERLFSGIKGFLERNGAWRTREMVNKELTPRMSLASKKSVGKTQMISVNAVLIATVAFQAAFTLPGEETQNAWFSVFVLCDALAFCSAITTAIMLVYAVYDKQEDSLLVKTSINALWVALVALALAFGVALLIKVDNKHNYLASTVWLMALAVPLAIRHMNLRSKTSIFNRDLTYMTWTFLIGGAVAPLLLIPLNYTPGKESKTTEEKKIPRKDMLISAIWITAGFVVFVGAILKLPMKTSLRAAFSVCGRTVCIVLYLLIVTLIWLRWNLAWLE